MKTAIEKAIEDIEGYRSFSNVIEIGFVCALLRNVYMGEEKAQIIEAYSNNGWNDGDERAYAEQYYTETYKQDK